jgi:small conductance mechanosensitive channel
MGGFSALPGLLWPLLPVAIIIIATVVIAWLVGALVGRLVRATAPQLARVARQFTIGAIAVIGATLALQALGVNPAIIFVIIALLAATALIALRGVLGNYGAKYFSDMFVPFKIGDTIQVRGVEGKVIEINPMTTVLLTESDQLVSVPNDAMLREIVVNTSPQAWKEVVVPVTIGGNVDLAAFESDVLKSLTKLRTRLDPRFPPVLTTKSRTSQSTDLILTLMLRRPEDRDSIAQEANKRMGEILDRNRGSRR